MTQALTQVLPEPTRKISRQPIGGIAPLDAGVGTIGARSTGSYGARMTAVAVPRQRAPQASFRQRVVSWRARNWRRAILAWFVLSLAIVAVAAEPKTDFPKAQTRSVPAVQVVLRVAGVLTAAGVPVLLIALP